MLTLNHQRKQREAQNIAIREAIALAIFAAVGYAVVVLIYTF